MGQVVARRSLTWAVGILALALPACGGGLKGYTVDTSPLEITSTTIAEPPNGPDTNTLFESADRVDFAIPLGGGCGGPYVLSVISGALPDGMGLDDSVDPGPTSSPADDVHHHHLRGLLLEDGVFRFRIQVVDKACDPFLTTHADFVWEVVRGAVTIVGAIPDLFPPGTLIKEGVVQNPVYPAIKTVVYNQFTSVQMIVAGGTPPYSMQVIDDPNNPDDGNLPLGTSIPPASTNIVGAPAEVKPGGLPFVFTLEVTDSTGRKGKLAVQWQVDTPPIIIANTDLPDGKCGTFYSETVVIVDGVPPFRFEFVRCDVDRGADGEPTVVYQSPQPPVITPACATERLSAADYPAQNLLGPDYRAFATPPEGIYIGDQENLALVANGSINGVPRRRGDYRVTLHVRSQLVPNERGQHSWKQFEFSVAPSEPPVGAIPAFGQNPVYTLEDVFAALPPYSRIAEAEVGANYNPDAASHPALGLQLLGRGGVRKDGKTDAPHASEVAQNDGLAPGQEDTSTPGGGYEWTVNYDPTGDGDIYSAAPPGTAFEGRLGVWSVTNPSSLARQGLQALEFTMLDQQLPTQVRNADVRRVHFAVGPDKVIITESPLSEAVTSGSTYAMNDHQQTVRVVEPYRAIAPVLRNLTSADLSPTHTVPSTTGGASIHTVLSTQDLLRVMVNPSGWWDDVHGLNAMGARPFQHGNPNKYYPWRGSGESGVSSWQPSVTAVDVQVCTTPTVIHAPLSGVYKDGGKLYAFGNTSYFGFFIVRSDATIYFPCAFDRGLYVAFGDGWVTEYGSDTRSLLRSPHLAVSPDGRFGAVKIKTSETNFTETSSTTKIVIFSLTGEKAFGGETFKIIGTGATGSASNGTYHYAPSMVLSNRHLYYLCGNNIGAPESSWHGHYVYRYELADAAGAVTSSSAAGAMLSAAVPDAAWTNTLNNRMQTPFQNWDSPGQLQQVFLPSGTFANQTVERQDAYLLDGGNYQEMNAAPVPFRVSRNGKAVAILAAPDPNTTSGTLVMSHHVWVDHDGAGVRRLSAAQRHIPNGGSRGYRLGYGPSSYPHWLRASGPTPHLEISDDASKVAVVVNRESASVSSFSSSNWRASREDVIAYRTSNSWVTATEIPVTSDGGSTHTIAGSGLWRFGSLAFTKDNKGLVFYAGVSAYNATSSNYSDAFQMNGSLWGADVSTATAITGITITNLLATTDGGTASGVASYTTASPYNPSLSAGGNFPIANGVASGAIKPFGGFMSKNREFLYLMTFGGVATGKSENLRLVGINVRSTNTAQNIGGRTDFRAFLVGNWPTRRGFVPNYYYFGSYPLTQGFYAPGMSQGGSNQVMARDSGNVYFATHYMRNGPTTGNSSSFGGPHHPSYWADYGAYGGQIEGFSAEVGGPVARLTSLGSDTEFRSIKFIEATNAGSELAFVFDKTSNVSILDQERVHYVGKIAFDAVGALVGTPASVAIEAGAGRAGDAMAFGFMRDRVYYAYQSGTGGNENNKKVMEVTIDPVTNTASTPRTLVGSPARYNVLHAGR